MKNLYFLFFLFPFTLNAQIYWTEDFGTGSNSCNDTQFAVNFSGSNGSWTVTQTGVNGINANEWYISSTSSSSVAGSCETGCSVSYNQTLHVANISTSPGALLFCPAGDCGPAYDDSDNTTATSKRIESPTINLSGINSAQMSFVYIHKGQSGFDEVRLWFFDGSLWHADSILPMTAGCAPTSTWTYLVVDLPSYADNNPNFKIGFEWKNNGDGIALDPSVSIDNIRIANSFLSSNEKEEMPFTYVVNDGKIYFDFNQNLSYQIDLFDLAGKEVLLKGTSSIIELPQTGIYLARVILNNQTYVVKVFSY